VILAVTVAMVSNWFIVVPKIRRILSGERVVISNVLRNVNGKFSKAQPGVTTSANYGEGVPANAGQVPESVSVAVDEARLVANEKIVLQTRERADSK
jgi:hypothetical protein